MGQPHTHTHTHADQWNCVCAFVVKKCGASFIRVINFHHSDEAVLPGPNSYRSTSGVVLGTRGCHDRLWTQNSSQVNGNTASNMLPYSNYSLLAEIAGMVCRVSAHCLRCIIHERMQYSVTQPPNAYGAPLPTQALGQSTFLLIGCGENAIISWMDYLLWYLLSGCSIQQSFLWWSTAAGYLFGWEPSTLPDCCVCLPSSFHANTNARRATRTSGLPFLFSSPIRKTFNKQMHQHTNIHQHLTAPGWQ